MLRSLWRIALRPIGWRRVLIAMVLTTVVMTRFKTLTRLAIFLNSRVVDYLPGSWIHYTVVWHPRLHCIVDLVV